MLQSKPFSQYAPRNTWSEALQLETDELRIWSGYVLMQVVHAAK